MFVEFECVDGTRVLLNTAHITHAEDKKKYVRIWVNAYVQMYDLFEQDAYDVEGDIDIVKAKLEGKDIRFDKRKEEYT